MNNEQLVLIESLITVAANQAGLTNPINNHGSFDGDGTVWSWRWMDAPDPIISGVEVYVLPDEGGEGAEIKVRSASFDYEDRSKSSSRLYWGRYIEYDDLLREEKMKDMVNEIKGGLSLAWQGLPQQVALLPELAEKERAFKDKLRNMGLLQE